MKLFQIFKNALLITIGHPVRSITMIICNGFIVYVSFSNSTFTFLIPFFMGSLIAVITFWHFNLIFGKLQSKQQEIVDKELEEAEKKQLEGAGDGNDSNQVHQNFADRDNKN